MKAWITYKFLKVVDYDEDDEILDEEVWDYGQEVEVLYILPPSYVSYKKTYPNGLFLVRSDENICAFDGQFISFIYPNLGATH